MPVRPHYELARCFPPHLYFVVSAIFHYLGPAFAVLLFAHVDVIGVVWLRIASAAVVFALWKRPWRTVRSFSSSDRRAAIALGVILASMNLCFYIAISRLPLGIVGAIEFLGPIALAAYDSRSARKLGALVCAAGGVFLLTHIQATALSSGYIFAFANCALFVAYIRLSHRFASTGTAPGLDRLAVAMIVAVVVVTPFSLAKASVALTSPKLLLAGLGVGICSSVIPYVTDQLAMARLSRPTFALMMSLLPATACVVGALVLRQIPSGRELVGVGGVIVGIALRGPDKRSATQERARFVSRRREELEAVS